MKDLVSTSQRHEGFGTPIDDEIGGGLGTLSSDIRVQLHTKQALKLFLGAKIESTNKRPDTYYPAAKYVLSSEKQESCYCLYNRGIDV